MNCRQAVRLMSEETDRELAGVERLSLRVHTLICKGCRNYRQQLSFVRQACQHLAPDAPEVASATPTSVRTPD